MLIFEEIEQDTEKIMNSLYDFLDVERRISKSPDQKYNESVNPKNHLVHLLYKTTALRKTTKSILSESINKKFKHSFFEQNKPCMNIETRDFLKSYFSEDIMRLSSLLRMDLHFWRA